MNHKNSEREKEGAKGANKRIVKGGEEGENTYCTENWNEGGGEEG